MKWLREGDQNTNFFHKVVKGRMLRNRIMHLSKSDGTLITDESSITAEILGYYEGLLGSPCFKKLHCTEAQLQGIISSTLSETQKLLLWMK